MSNFVAKSKSHIKQETKMMNEVLENPFTIILDCENVPIPLHMKKEYVNGIFEDIFKRKK